MVYHTQVGKGSSLHFCFFAVFFRKEPNFMSSLRQDCLTGRWVIIAAQRQGRPNEFVDGFLKKLQQPPDSTGCPFCCGRENLTPPEVMATGRGPRMEADSPDWRVRVVPNKFPAVHCETNQSSLPDASLLRPEGPAEGGHEVVVCCPGHQESLGTLEIDHVEEVLWVVRQRIQALGKKHPSARYVLAFGNQGPDAGATLAHAHLQIITTPVVPALVVDKTESFIRHKAETDHCLLCDCLADEVDPRTWNRMS